MDIYMEMLERGESIAKKIEDQDITSLGLTDSVALATYQFAERWLTNYTLCEISFIAVQFDWC